MSEGSFEKIGESSENLYGPRAILVCGFIPSQQKKMMNFLKNLQITDVSLIFATDEDAEINLGQLMAYPNNSGLNENSSIDRAVVLSGVSEMELQQILSNYKKTGLPRPLWATLTPFSENWTLANLLEELNKERMEMEKRKK